MNSTCFRAALLVAATACSASPLGEASDAPLPCVVEASSTLPHVRFELSDTNCTFTTAEIKSGISIPYDLVVEEDVPDFVPVNPYWYGPDVANLALSEIL